LLMASCRSGKLQKKGVDLGKATTDSTVHSPDLVIAEPQFTELRLRSEAGISSSEVSRKFPVTIHIRKDSMIWASVSLGLELARAKITKDSLIFLDRFNRKAYIGTWDELGRASGFDLNFNLLQALLTGGMLFPPEEGDDIEPGSAVSLIRQVRNGIPFESRIDNSVHKLFEVQGEDIKRGSKLELGFKRFVTQDEQLIPSVISMLLSGRKNARLEITHSRIEFLEQGLSFSFSIPGSYDREPLPGI
ncbi:MAG: DUF4292 domain-containing protein, partial [Leadbetterella sp.]|nr:DUF4292 domain-containing protein [Leadbetterella sp.]